MSNIDPFFIASNAAGAISYSLQDPYPTSFSSTSFIPGGSTAVSTTYIPSEVVAMTVLVCYIVASLVIANIMFKRRQF